MKSLKEQEIKAGLKQIAGQTTFTKQQEMQNLQQIHQKLNQRRSIRMTGKGKKIILAVAALAALCATTAIAAGKITGYYSSVSNQASDYATAQDIEKSKELLGKVPKVPAEFSNGLQYKNGVNVLTEGRDASGQTVTSETEVMVTYGEDITLDIRKGSPMDQYLNAPVETAEIDGIAVAVYQDNYLFLPPDAEPSAEDLLLEEQGKLFISYGTATEQQETFRYVVWEEDGLGYMLNTFSDSYGPAELIQMSREIIQYK